MSGQSSSTIILIHQQQCARIATPTHGAIIHKMSDTTIEPITMLRNPWLQDKRMSHPTSFADLLSRLVCDCLCPSICRSQVDSLSRYSKVILVQRPCWNSSQTKHQIRMVWHGTSQCCQLSTLTGLDVVYKGAFDLGIQIQIHGRDAPIM